MRACPSSTSRPASSRSRIPSGTTWIVFNGEIFNYVELREELIALGHRFRTRSDTEVIVHAYRAWGDGAFERFNGQWAIALWDASGPSPGACRATGSACVRCISASTTAGCTSPAK